MSCEPWAARMARCAGAGISEKLGGLERVMGIEPTLFAWEARVLPLNDTRLERHCTVALRNRFGWGKAAESQISSHRKCLVQEFLTCSDTQM